MTLLVLCAAMALDILAPWSESYSVRQSLVSRFGHPAFVVVGLALLAALPLYQPRFRRAPLCAAAPLVIGALAVGVGTTYYIFLARENAQVVSATSSGFSPQQAASIAVGTPISPQLGLYLFILIGVVLVVVGYQLFLAAVQSQYVIIAPAQLQALAQVHTPQPVITLPFAPVAHGMANGNGGAPSPVSLPAPQPFAVTSVAPAVARADATAAPQPAPHALPIANGSAPLAGPTPTPPTAPASAAPKNLALPGTDAWNQPPTSPEFGKHARLRGGWRRSAR